MSAGESAVSGVQDRGVSVEKRPQWKEMWKASKAPTSDAATDVGDPSPRLTPSRREGHLVAAAYNNVCIPSRIYPPGKTRMNVASDMAYDVFALARTSTIDRRSVGNNKSRRHTVLRSPSFVSGAADVCFASLGRADRYCIRWSELYVTAQSRIRGLPVEETEELTRAVLWIKLSETGFPEEKADSLALRPSRPLATIRHCGFSSAPPLSPEGDHRH
ncbi:hypothetical protein B0H11DRAFT_2231202 [Mycena galericulata]|nr:hypothetical protein B0H11DRAFT_2231202 [Mycena galericulata]